MWRHSRMKPSCFVFLFLGLYKNIVAHLHDV
jgi:hypothetical protein